MWGLATAPSASALPPSFSALASSICLKMDGSLYLNEPHLSSGHQRRLRSPSSHSSKLRQRFSWVQSESGAQSWATQPLMAGLGLVLPTWLPAARSFSEIVARHVLSKVSTMGSKEGSRKEVGRVLFGVKCISKYRKTRSQI